MDYWFEIELDVDEFTDDLANKVFEACDDALVGQQFGKITVDFIREADSYEEAIKSAQEDLIKAGIPIKE